MKTQAEQLKKFKKYVNMWSDRMGLTSMDIWVGMDSLDGNIAATCHRTDVSSYSIFLSKGQARDLTDKELNRYAFHEVLHVALGDVDYLLRSRFVTQEQVRQAIEKFTTRMENFMFGRLK
jgi:hypothetical protein